MFGVTIVKGRKILANQFQNGSYPTLGTGLDSSKLLKFTINNSVVEINGDSKIVKPDLLASNGVVHGIDAVLFPEQGT